MIRIVTDSSADISPQVAVKQGITVIPIRIRMGGRMLRDGLDIDRSDLYRHFPRTSSQPTAEPPTQQEFQEVYNRLLKDADQVLSIHLSSKVSRTCQVAQEAAKQFHGRTRI